MNVVQNQWQPRVIRIGFPVTTTTNRNVMDSNGFSRSFPILAVTRSKTMPYVTVSEAMGPRKQTTRVKISSSHGYSKEKLPRSFERTPSSVSGSLPNGKASHKNYAAESEKEKSDKPRASSLPVWPVTNLSTITKMSENSDKVLPKPRLNLEWSGWKRPRRTSFPSGSSREATSASSHRPNTTKSAQHENRKTMVRIKPPPRSCTPMSEYDPDKLNIKQVVKFLDTQDKDLPKQRSRSNYQVSISRPRPFTVAYTDDKPVGRAVVSAQSTRNPGISSRRSPVAARRYMRSAKTREAKDRSLSVSPLGMTEKGSRNRKDWRYNKKMDTLASIAARYNPKVKGDDDRPVEKDPDSSKEGSLLSYRETTNSSPEQHFGKLRYQSATFHSFPTNKVDSDITEKVASREDNHVETNESIVYGNKDHSDIETHDSAEQADVNLSTFNAVNAIRLPSVFDNVDGESECGWTGIVPLTKQFEVFGVNGQFDQDQELPNSECTSRSTSRPTSREKNRHSRNLSLVLAREKSTERSFSPDRKIKFRQTGNWVKNCFGDPKGKLIELKLTHGSPSA